MFSRRTLRYLGRRLTLLCITLWGVATMVFFMVKTVPGDEAQVAAGVTASAEQVEIVRERLGLDQPLIHQYISYLGRLVRGDLGTSIFTFSPVVEDLGRLLPFTIELVATAMAVNILVGVPLGVLAAARHRARTDNAIRLFAIACGSLPLFWLGMVAQSVFGSSLKIFPIGGAATVGVETPKITGFGLFDSFVTGDFVAFSDRLAHLVLPASVLAVPFMAFVVRVVRSSMITALENDHVIAARAKGASDRRVLVQHCLRNSMAPIITLVGLQLGWMIGGAVLVETVFARPGVGSYLSEAVAQKDTFAVLGMVVVIGTIVTVAGLVVDLIQLAVDPRVRVRMLGAES